MTTKDAAQLRSKGACFPDLLGSDWKRRAFPKLPRPVRFNNSADPTLHFELTEFSEHFGPAIAELVVISGLAWAQDCN